MGHDAAHAEGGDELVSSFERARLGMWLFLASEIMMFGAFIACYVVLRMSVPAEVLAFLNSTEIDPETGLRIGQLSWEIAFLNTLVLIISTYTMVRAVNAISKGNKGHCEDMLIATAVLGVVFLVIKIGWEYLVKFDHGIYPSTNVLFSCYFLMTGFHGFHVLVGIILIAWCAFYVKKEYLNYWMVVR